MSYFTRPFDSHTPATHASTIGKFETMPSSIKNHFHHHIQQLTLLVLGTDVNKQEPSRRAMD